MDRRHVIGRMALGGLGLAAGMSYPAQAQDGLLDYARFDGVVVRVRPWLGQRVAILSARTALDPQVMTRLLTCIDRGHAFYASLGALPAVQRIVLSRLPIAEVETTCGAGCGYLGHTGIELQTDTFERLYAGMRDHGQIDQAVMYELGRNFWVYGPQLDKVEPFVTGFAILNRFLSIRASGFPGGPFDALDYVTFEDSILNALWHSYIESDLNWTTTLAVGRAPPGRWGASDFAAALLHRVVVEAGLSGYRGFWTALRAAPPAQDQVAAIQNVVRAAAIGARIDIAPLFRDPAIRLS